MKTDSFLSSRMWRYATKRFDSSKKVSEEHLQLILESIRLTPTSYGLQPFKVMVVTSLNLREQLRSAGFNQPQFTDASHLLAFAHYDGFSEELIDRFIALNKEIRKPDPEKIEGYGSFLKDLFGSWSTEQKAHWADKQMYLALGNALQAAADLKVDSCALEGFDAGKANEVLGLSEQHLSVTAFLALGYRSSEDATQHLPKVRVPSSDLFEII
jgi:nitroreductase